MQVNPSKKNRALIIAHYHRDGKIRSDTLDFLNACDHEFERIIFVSTKLQDEERKKIPQYVECHVRDNIGYDFFSYRLGIEKLLDHDVDKEIQQITIMNTSFLIFDTKNFLQKYFNEGLGQADFYGLTMHYGSREHSHLQSFLLTFNKQLLRDYRFTNWWRKMIPFEEKSLLIKKYEIGLSKYLEDIGYKLNPVFPIDLRSGYADPMHGSFLEILEKFSILKIGLIVLNPFKLSLSSINTKIRESEAFKKLIIEGMEN